MGTDKAVGLYIILLLVVVLIASGGAGELFVVAVLVAAVAGFLIFLTYVWEWLFKGGNP